MIDPPFPTNPVPHLSISHIIERVTHWPPKDISLTYLYNSTAISSLPDNLADKMVDIMYWSDEVIDTRATCTTCTGHGITEHWQDS